MDILIYRFVAKFKGQVEISEIPLAANQPIRSSAQSCHSMDKNVFLMQWSGGSYCPIFPILIPFSS